MLDSVSFTSNSISTRKLWLTFSMDRCYEQDLRIPGVSVLGWKMEKLVGKRGNLKISKQCCLKILNREKCFNNNFFATF